jgi:hypothetical protein
MGLEYKGELLGNHGEGKGKGEGMGVGGLEEDCSTLHIVCMKAA